MEQTVEPMDVDTSFTTDDGATELCRDDKIEASKDQPIISGSRYESREGKIATAIAILTKEEQAKMEERAKRFGLEDKLIKTKVKKDKKVHSSMATAKESDNTKHLRLNALHAKGTEDMSTKDVIKYFDDYDPASVEWMTDVSCIKGLLTESRKRQYKQLRQPKKRADNNGLSDGVDDRKRAKNPWGKLSETWGINDTVEDTFLRSELTTESKSNVKERLGFKSQAKEIVPATVSVVEEESESEAESKSSDKGWCTRSKGLRMRMHADDEEEKVLKKRIKQRAEELRATTQTENKDLRSRLRNSKGNSNYRDTIQVVVANTSDRYRVSRPLTPEEQDEALAETVQENEAEEEIEEGEWIEASEENEEPVEEEIAREEGEEESDNSDVSEKEVQGPKGSVIKVVPRVKPRVASTVWARLNNTKPVDELKNRFSSKGDLRGTLKGDLRSRLGHQKRGRSPLRIEVKNDKYAEESSGTD